MSSFTRQQLENWIKSKEVSGRVLDIGGSQLPVSKRIQAKKDTEFVILDLEVPHEEKLKPDIIGDLNNKSFFPVQSVHILKHLERYDYAICLEVSEYWWNPVVALENIRMLLKPGATLFISFHFIYPVHNPINEDCLRYTRPGVRKLLEKTGFKIKDITSRVANNSPSDYFSGEGMREARGYDFHDEVGVLVEAIKI